MSLNITLKNFRKDVIGGRQLAVVQFRTKWSGASHIIEPIYNDLAKKYKGKMKFYCVDAEEEEGTLKNEYGIMDIPTALFFRNGSVVDYLAGLASKDAFIIKIETIIQTNK